MKDEIDILDYSKFLDGKNYLTIDEMMQLALNFSEKSYYRSVKNLGVDGDFVTAPEISQIFGEIIALWAIEKWQMLGSPTQIYICEFGAGQGKLLNDFCRVAKLVPNFFAALQLVIYEINPHFQKKQQQLLAKYSLSINWQQDIYDLPKGPTIIIANEFFDAMPIKQYLKYQEDWWERTIIPTQEKNKWRYDKLKITLNLAKHVNAGEGAIIEMSMSSVNIVKNISQHCLKYGGFALIIDYGYNIEPVQRQPNQYNSTLQALKNHSYQPVLQSIADADITAHVDFQALIEAVKSDIQLLNYCQQSKFLAKYGLFLRATLLKKNLPESEQKLIDRQIERLTAPTQMGELFKVLEIGNINKIEY